MLTLIAISRLLLRWPFLFHCSCDHRHIHSFPTRRSSDLNRFVLDLAGDLFGFVDDAVDGGAIYPSIDGIIDEAERSEEHTSELQSLRHLVCRLLLEKKKKQNKTENTQQ